MIATAVYCASRLAAARRWRRPTEHDVDLMHAVMGVAMAGMLVPRLNVLGHGGWEAVFAAAIAWFGWQIFRGRRGGAVHGHRPTHHAPHLLACGAMLYMLLVAGAARAGASMPGMAMGAAAADAAHSPGLALPLALALLGYVIWTTDRLTALPRVAALAAYIPVPALDASSNASLAATSAPAAEARRAMPADWADVGSAGSRARPVRSRRLASPDRRPPDRRPPARRPVGRPPMSPRLAACCEIAMGVTMGYMLIQML